MITFQVETYDVLRREIQPLLPLHWEEIALDKEAVPLDPDWDEYDRLAALGRLHLLTVRNDAELVGYFVGIIKPHLHYRTSLTAKNDVLYIKPEYRTGRTPLRFFHEIERTVKERGAQRLYINSKRHKDFGPLLEFLEYQDTEGVFTKLL